MSVRKIGGVLFLLASAGVPQDLPPEVLLLARIKTHMRDVLSRLPDYTCLETVSRFHKEASQASLKPLDTVRLEIIYSDHREWFGSPGDKNLDSSSPASFVGSGMIGTGTFATALKNVLSGAHFVYRGKETLADRAAVKFDFQFPRQPGAFEISMVGGAGNVGEKGSIWADEQSLDLIRLEYRADDIPAYLPLAEQSNAVNYARAQIGAGYTLLAQQADTQLLRTSGVENLNHIEFTHCRAYSTESTIRFDTEAPSAPAATGREIPTVVSALPALLAVTVRLDTPISNSDAVGKPIGGKIVGDVAYKKKIVIPNGALVHGRIRRLERFQGTTRHNIGAFIVGLEFTEVEMSGGRVPFYADLLSMDRDLQVRATLAERVPRGNDKIILPELPGVASFFVNGPTFTLAAGFKTVWRTRGPIRGN